MKLPIATALSHMKRGRGFITLGSGARAGQTVLLHEKRAYWFLSKLKQEGLCPWAAAGILTGLKGVERAK